MGGQADNAGDSATQSAAHLPVQGCPCCQAPINRPFYAPCRFAAKPFHAEALTSFIRTVLAKGDVYFLTYSQLVDWMKAPVGTAQMASWLTCKPVDFAAEGEPYCFQGGVGCRPAAHSAGPAGSRSPFPTLDAALPMPLL